MGAQVGGDGREEKEGQVVVASCNRSRAESHRLATRSGGSQSVRGRAKDKRPRQEIALCRIGATTVVAYQDCF